MKKVITCFNIIIFCSCISTKMNAQVVYERADKWQGVDGFKLEPTPSKKKLKPIKSSSITQSVNSKDSRNIPNKKNKNLKPNKAVKYGIRKNTNSINEKDDE